MTFDAAVSADWGTALAELRDTVGGMTDWAIKDDPTAGATSLSTGDSFVLTSSAPAEDLRLEVTGQGGLAIEHGPTWDAAGDSWTDRFAYDPQRVEDFHGNDPYNVFPCADDTALAMDDAGTYWLEYVDRGFAFYWQREVGDGNDEDIWLGMCEVTKAWDYTTAASREAQNVLGFGCSNASNQRLIHMSESGTGTSGNESYRAGNNSYDARGLVNPDNNLDNYPLTNNIVSSSVYRTSSGEDAVIGDFNLWVADISGAETGHKDLIQDGSSTDIYTILKRQGTPSILLRMD